jgi:DNA-binding NarL/FixJ family response regulator
MTTPRSDANGICVLILDPIRLNRDNLVTMLRREPSIMDAFGAADCEEAMRALRRERPTVVLVSMAGAVGQPICRDLVSAADPVPVIAYAVSGSYSEVVACAEAGVGGYLLQDEPQTELMKAVATAARGDVWCPPRVAAVLMRRMGPGGAARDRPAGVGRLTVREREILGLIDEGMSNKEIARKLSIEVRTVKNHVHNLLEKLQVHRRGEAAALVRGRTAGTLS